MTFSHQKITKHTIAKAVVWITLFSMAAGSLMFTPQLFKRFTAQPSGIMTINGHAIALKELQFKTAHELERIAFIRQQLGPTADQFMQQLGLDNPEQTAIKNLIIETYVNEAAQKAGVAISEEYILRVLQDPSFVMRYLREIIPFSALDRSGAINMPMLHEYMSRLGFSSEDLEATLAHAIERSLMSDLIKNTAYISSGDIKQYFDTTYRGKKFSILTIAYAPLVKQAKTVAPTNQELETFFKQENSSSHRYWIPEQRTATMWTFAPQQYGIEIADADITAYYQSHKQKYSETPIMVQVRRILFPVTDASKNDEVLKTAQQVKAELEKDPSQFAALAKKYSADKKTASQGGLLPFFKKGEMHPDFERAAFRLYNDGDISDIIITDEGLELIQRVSRKSATYKALEAVKKDIVTTLLQEQFKESFLKDMRSLVDTVRSNKEQVDSLVREKQATTKKITVSKDKNIESLVVQKIFKTPQHEWAFLVDKDGNGILLNVTDVKKTYEPSLETVKDKVQEDYYAYKAHATLQELLKKAQTLSATMPMATVKNQVGGTLSTTGWINQESKDELQALDKKGVPVEKVMSLEQVGATTTALTQEYGYLIKYEEQEPFNQESFDARAEAIKTTVTQEQKDLIYRGYIASLDRHATLKLIQQHETQNEGTPLEDISL